MEKSYSYIFKKENVLKRVLRAAIVMVAAKQILHWLCPIEKVTVVTTKIVDDKPVETKSEE